MNLKRRYLFCAFSVCVLAAACGGPKTGPTPDAPQITCPAAPTPVESLDGSAQAVSFPAPTVTGGQLPLNTSCTPVSGSSFTIGTTSVACTTTDARARTASCSFNIVVLPQPKLSVTSFLAFGDSLTWGEDGRDAASALAQQHVFVQLPPGQPYPDVLRAELQARYQQQSPTVDNGGLRGESLADTTTNPPTPNADTFARFVSLTSSRRWDAVLIMEGSNDANVLAGDSRVLPPAIDTLRRMVGDAKSRGMRVIVATIPPMVPPGVGGRARGYQVVPTFNDGVRGVASSENDPLADVYQAFGSDAPTLIGFDGLHPNPAGYQRIADTFFATIKSSFETSTTSRQGVTRRR